MEVAFTGIMPSTSMLVSQVGSEHIDTPFFKRTSLGLLSGRC